MPFSTECHGVAVNVFVGANVAAHGWRSPSLRARYGSIVETTFPCYTKFAWDTNPETCNKRDCRRISRHVSIILAAMNASLATGRQWSLFFEDDAILNDKCDPYCLPQPIPKECEYVSLDNRALYGPGTNLGNGYTKSHGGGGTGHGTAAFWFSRRFARYMLAAAIKGYGKPPDLFIFESGSTRGICKLRHDCTVHHDDNPKLRLFNFSENMLGGC